MAFLLFCASFQAHEAAAKTGHGGMDFYPIYDFAACILTGKKPDIDVYQAVETAAPVIMAGLSAEQGGQTMDIPDFRPGKDRKKGEQPK